MKKTITILFLLVFLCANTEIGQLLKFPNLVHHYFEHSEHEQDHIVSFIDFVKSHYNNKQHSDKDEHDNHNNLPFKTMNDSNTILAFDSEIKISFYKPNVISTRSIIPFFQKFYISDFFACIWLPPKLS